MLVSYVPKEQCFVEHESVRCNPFCPHPPYRQPRVSAMLPLVYLLPRVHPVKMLSVVLAMETLINSVCLKQRLAFTGSNPTVNGPHYMYSVLNKCDGGIITNFTRFEGSPSTEG